MADRTPGYIDGRRMRVGGVPIWGPVPNVPIPGSMEAYGIFDDFMSIEDLAGAGSTPTGKATWEYFIQFACGIAMADEPGGAVIMTTGGADEDSGQIILGSAAGGGAFKPAAGKHIWFEARVKAGNLGAAAENNYFIGLVKPEAVVILTNAGAIPTDDEIIGFIKRDQALEVNWSFMGSKGDVQLINTLGAGCVVDDAYHYFGFYVNGVTDVAVYYDRVLIAAGALPTANIPVTGIMPAVAVKSGDVATVVDTITIDYIMCVQLR